jgi:hypothetical protein
MTNGGDSEYVVFLCVSLFRSPSSRLLRQGTLTEISIAPTQGRHAVKTRCSTFCRRRRRRRRRLLLVVLVHRGARPPTSTSLFWRQQLQLEALFLLATDKDSFFQKRFSRRT